MDYKEQIAYLQYLEQKKKDIEATAKSEREYDTALQFRQAIGQQIAKLTDRAEAAERERDEAVHDRMVMEQRTAELVNRLEADNKKLIAAMMQIKRTDRPERLSVVYELEYDSSLSHKTTEDVAGILFRGLMDADLKMRGQKEE